MTLQQALLCDVIKRMGYSPGEQVKLYGMKLNVISDPFCIGDNVVFIDAEELVSGQKTRVRLPRSVVRVAASGKPHELV
jgi:hypothetical protein